MDKDRLELALKVKEEIEKLDRFIFVAERVWRGKLIHKESETIFKTFAFGAFNEVEYPMDTEMKNKVLDILRERLQYLKDKLESI